MRSNRMHTQRAVDALHNYLDGKRFPPIVSADTKAEILVDDQGNDQGMLFSLYDRPIMKILKTEQKITDIYVFSGFYYDMDGNPTKTTRERLNGLLDALGTEKIIPCGVRVIIDREYSVVYLNHNDNKIALNKNYCDAIVIIPDPIELRYRQNSLPIGPAALAPTLYGPAQPLPASMQLAEQGLLDVLPLGPLFDIPEPPAST